MNNALVDRIVNAALFTRDISLPLSPVGEESPALDLRRPVSARVQRRTGWHRFLEMQTECLFAATIYPSSRVKVRFLHLMRPDGRRIRSVARRMSPRHETAAPIRRAAPSGRSLFQAWQEAVERESVLRRCNLVAELVQPRLHLGSMSAPRADPRASAKLVGTHCARTASGRGVCSCRPQRLPTDSGCACVQNRTVARANAAHVFRDEAMLMQLGVHAHHSRSPRTANSSRCSTRPPKC